VAEHWSEKILTDWGVGGGAPEREAVRVFERVRDIPFGQMGSRDPAEVYRRNKGTCSGKNLLLRELLQRIGLQARDMICLQRWKDITWFPDDTYGLVRFPDELVRMLQETEIVDFHNYVELRVGERWVTLDATIDPPLRRLGFHTTERWDGRSSMPLCFAGSHKVWSCGDDGLARKAELTARLPDESRAARKRFLVRLTAWIDDLRERGEL